MTEPYILDKKNISPFIKKASKNYHVVGPVKTNDIFHFSPITNPQEIAFDYDNSMIPPKKLFFPQTETLFKFINKKPPVLHPPNQQSKDLLVLAIRPCDANSLRTLDNIFNGTYKDSPYLFKRKHTVLIGLACNNPSVNCFCTSLGGSPHDTTNLDILMTDMGDTFVVEPCSKKGSTFIKEMDMFKPATKNDITQCTQLKKTAQKKIKRQMNSNNIDKALETLFDNSLWEDIAQSCIGCGICTFLCPTCHCFDIQDETIQSHGARVRVWDSCMYPEYTIQASGYNPRPKRMNRLRNRVYHKFHAIPKTHNIIACVGCGRCIDACPVNIDIINIIERVQEAKKQ
jgi:ferredoxin